MKLNDRELERFLSKIVKKLSGKRCWLWTGTVSESRRGGLYGRFFHGGKNKRAHRVSFEHYVGPIPDGYTVDHTCKNTLCVNPGHLEAVTNLENIARSNGRCAAAVRAKIGGPSQ